MKKIICFSLVTVCFFCFAMQSNAQWNLTGNSNATATSILGTTTSVPLNLTTNNVQRLVIDANGKIGIGTTTPINILTVKGTGSTPAPSWVAAGAPLFVGFGENAVGNADYILAMASTSNNGRPVFVGRRSRGTLAVPTAMANNDFIMSMLASGFDGAAFQNPATIDFFVDGTPTAGNVPARISFVTGSNSSNRAERLKIGNTGDITFNTNQFFLQKATGNMGIGTLTPTAKLEVNGQVKITGGVPGAGKVLTSDSAGLATWTTPAPPIEVDPKVGTLSTGKVPKWNGATLTNGSITDNGNIGIGETNPQGILHVSQPFNFVGIAFNGPGLNDLTTNISGYNGIGATSYVIRIQNPGPDPNSIEISNDGGTTFASPVAISNPIILANGVTATFASTSGHTFGNQWAWTVGGSFNNILVAKNGKVSIGTTNADATLHIAGNVKIADGTQGNGKVLTSDSNGKASWQSVSALEADPKVGALTVNKVPNWNGTTLINGSITDSAGYVGVGTGTPKAVLDVNGDALVNGITIGRGNDSSSLIVGRDALDSNTTGIGNSAIGLRALNSNRRGSSNIAIGVEALNKDTSGSANIAIGNAAMHENKNRSGLVAIGDSALFANTGSGNIAIGQKALRFANGNNNTAIGDRSMLNTLNGSYNTTLGGATLLSNTSGSYNTAVGYECILLNTTGYDNTGVGYEALRKNTSGSQNTATGSFALYGTGNPTASNNTANGYGSLFNISSGYSNTATGSLALVSNSVGNNNTGIGDSALFALSSGSANTAVGKRALAKTTSSGSTAVGTDALKENDGGFDNTAVGRGGLSANTTGSFNVALGNITMQSNTNGSLNTAIGYNANLNAGGFVNASAIGANSLASASNSMQLGSTSVSSIKGGNNVTIVSDQRFKKDIQENVPGLEFISQLRPVTYTFDIHKLNTYIAPEGAPKPGEIEEAAIKAKEQIHYTGFLAQEVEKAAGNINYDFSGLYKPQNSKDPYGLSYAEFVVPLVKAVQELSVKNEELSVKADKVDDLQKQIDELKDALMKLVNQQKCVPTTGK